MTRHGAGVCRLGTTLIPPAPVVSSHTFTNFSVTLDPTTDLPVATNITAIIGCTLTQLVPVTGHGDSTLNADWEGKKGNSTSTEPNQGFRLSEDGVWIQKHGQRQSPPTACSFSLSITGLAAGTHTITTYHNSIFNSSWVNAADPYLSRCIISVGGVPVFTNTPSLLVSNDFKCWLGFLHGELHGHRVRRWSSISRPTILRPRTS